MRVPWAACRKDSAVPGVAISACTKACTQPLPRSQSPSVFRAAISMWSPPNITTILSSPHFSGHFHCICFAKANSDWSNVTTGVWPGFTCSTAFLTTSMECRIMATLWALSRNSGSWAVGLMVRANCGWRLALNAYHDMFSAVPVLPSVIRLACSTQV